MTDEQHHHWKCRVRGNHLWGYPAEAYEMRETEGSSGVPSIQVCVRAGCEATKDKPAPEKPIPDAVVGRYLTAHGAAQRMAGLPLSPWDLLWFREDRGGLVGLRGRLWSWGTAAPFDNKEEQG